MTERVHDETRLMYTTIRDELLAEGRNQGVAQGKAEGKAELLLSLLTTRGLSVSSDQRQLIARCRDEALLQRWFERAITADDATGIFED